MIAISSRSCRFPTGRCRERGTVLIIVMWIALGLVTVALYFGQSMVLEYRAADNHASVVEAAHAIEGARRYVTFLLSNLEEPGRMPELDTYAAEQVPVGDAAFWLIGRRDEDEPDDVPVFGLVDVASKLNLNMDVEPEQMRQILETLPGMPLDLAASIMDWRDTDSELTPDGAESETYLLLDPGYYCKDSDFETVEELRLVMGADWDVLYGEDTNRNGVRDPNEDDGDETWPEDDMDGRLDPGLLEYLTVYSREPNKRDDGSERINVNNDGDGQLRQLLEETFGSARADEIEQARGGSGGDVGSVLEFYILSGMTPDEFSQIEDALSVTDASFVEGLVNVNTAPAAVLACLPGIGEEYASQLVAYRLGKTTADLATVAWVAEVMDGEAAREAGPYLTTRTYQFAADVAAVGHMGRGFRRTLFIFDTSGGEPAIVCRRDLTRLGWPLGAQVRDQYALMTE